MIPACTACFRREGYFFVPCVCRRVGLGRTRAYAGTEDRVDLISRVQIGADRKHPSAEKSIPILFHHTFE